MKKTHLKTFLYDVDASILRLQDARADAKKGAYNSSKRNMREARRHSNLALILLLLTKEENQREFMNKATT